MKKDAAGAIANFIFETGILSKTPRSGLWFFGTGSQSVAEHIVRTAFTGYALGHLTPGVSKERIVLLCLFHDLGEGRTSDLNYVHQRYGRLAEANAIRDIAG
ncbi:MAG: HD domain-containing protein, partial [bacterium]|nr:HD domain-containing protein [bacterium]